MSKTLLANYMEDFKLSLKETPHPDPDTTTSTPVLLRERNDLYGITS